MTIIRPVTLRLVSLALLCAVLPAHAQDADARRTAVRTVPLKYAEIGPDSPEFMRLWRREAERDDLNPTTGRKPTVYITNVRAPDGALLTITMLSAREECGPRICPFKVIRDGRQVAEFSACMNTDDHRISSDGKTLLICESRIAIPSE